MKAVGTIFWKEFKSYFISPVGYVVITGFTALSGFLFYQILAVFIRITTLMRGYMEKGNVIREWTLVDDLMQPLYRDLGLFLIIMVPAVTMRLFAEEKKLRTEELLLTSPVRMSSVVLGKYLASLALLFLMLAPAGVYLLIVLVYGDEADVGPMVAGYGGLFLIAFALAAIGVFASSLTENQIIAFFVSVVLSLFFFTVGLAGNTVQTITLFSTKINFGELLRQLSLTDHYNNLVRGMINTMDIYYFLAMIVFFLFLSRFSAERARRS
jgi:ABC-2 type transport system permease protein